MDNKQEFKVGDRVRLVGNVNDCGATGTVIRERLPDCSYVPVKVDGDPRERSIARHCLQPLDKDTWLARFRDKDDYEAAGYHIMVPNRITPAQVEAAVSKADIEDRKPDESEDAWLVNQLNKILGTNLAIEPSHRFYF